MQEYIALSLFRIDLSSVGQYGKGCGQYIPGLTSRSVNKSIVLNIEYKVLNIENKGLNIASSRQADVSY